METIKERIKKWADGFNRILAPEKQFSVEDVRNVYDKEFEVHCIAVRTRMTLLYANTLEVMCERTCTKLYGIEPSSDGLILLLCDNPTHKTFM